MQKKMRKKALILAVTSTVLWSSSFILNKVAFSHGIGPFFLAGLRYLIASIFLSMVFALTRTTPSKSKIPLSYLVVLGIFGYAIAQGMMSAGQFNLSPTQSSLLMSITNILSIMAVDALWLKESQNKGAYFKLMFLVAGITLFYLPWDSSNFSWLGVMFVAMSSIGASVNITLNRFFLHRKEINPKTLMVVPMFSGAVILLIVALFVETLPVFSVELVLIILYLAIVNGGTAFYMRTWSQKYLTTFESSSITNLMIIEIAIMDFIFFRQNLNTNQIVAILIVFVTIVSIQFSKTKMTLRRKEKNTS